MEGKYNCHLFICSVQVYYNISFKETDGVWDKLTEFLSTSLLDQPQQDHADPLPFSHRKLPLLFHKANPSFYTLDCTSPLHPIPHLTFSAGFFNLTLSILFFLSLQEW